LKHSLPEIVSPNYKEEDPTFRANVVVEGDSPSLRWEKDGKLYSPSELAAKVFKALRPDHPVHLSISGSAHWGSPSESLRSWADRVRNSTSA
jgi:hypothetical protein